MVVLVSCQHGVPQMLCSFIVASLIRLWGYLWGRIRVRIKYRAIVDEYFEMHSKRMCTGAKGRLRGRRKRHHKSSLHLIVILEAAVIIKQLRVSDSDQVFSNCREVKYTRQLHNRAEEVLIFLTSWSSTLINNEKLYERFRIPSLTSDFKLKWWEEVVGTAAAMTFIIKKKYTFLRISLFFQIPLKRPLRAERCDSWIISMLVCWSCGKLVSAPVQRGEIAEIIMNKKKIWKGPILSWMICIVLLHLVSNFIESTDSLLLI